MEHRTERTHLYLGVGLLLAALSACSDDAAPRDDGGTPDRGTANLDAGGNGGDAREAGPADGGATGPDSAVKLGGFGDPCAKAAPCATGLECFFFQPTDAKGFCSRTCTKVSQACSGGAAGTMPYCVLQAGSSYYCAFICKVSHSGHEHTYPCPSSLKCNPKLIPPATSSYLCIP